MKRGLVAFSVALSCLGLSLASAWLWQTMAEAQFEAGARLLLPESASADAATPESDSDVDVPRPPRVTEAEFLSPELLSAAVTLLHERGMTIPESSQFESMADYLVEHTRVKQPLTGRPGEISIRCSAPDSAEAVQLTQAIVDAYLTIRRAEPVDDDLMGEDGVQAELKARIEKLSAATDSQKRVINRLTRRLNKMYQEADQGQEIAELEIERERVRAAHQSSLVRLAAARQDVENLVPPETVATRIADVSARTRILDRLNLTKVQDELQRQIGRRLSWSKKYGKNHPKMQELNTKISDLEQQLASFPLDDPHQAGRQAGQSPATIVLTAFETESTQCEQAEDELVQKLQVARQRLQSQDELAAKLALAQQNLAGLQNELEQSRKELTVARHVHPELDDIVTSPPGLVGEPLGRKAGLPMAVCCVAGMVVYMTLLWQIRRKWIATDRVTRIESRAPVAAPREPRYRSKEEEQLMRLKLAVRG